MIGKTISHYKIIEKLGSGSMGTVFKAEDTKLKRIVALKFLPPHLITGKTEKHRFLHEAQAASALNHPNIITIFDIVEELDKVFIVMEYCDGVMLTEKLKDGPLKQKELLNIAIGVAEGLNAAHKADITHRDIKSQNIIISEDCPPKIIDFGIAKQVGMTDITKDGTTLGTQCYMSPEQLHGSKVDKRSDIFSFGVVLYEMATGKLPFTGKHDAEILYSVVNEEPIPITTLNPNMDAELQRIVDKALKKDVKDRYQHIDDMLADLRNLKNRKQPKKHLKKSSWWRIPSYIAGVIIIVTIIYSLFLKKDDLTIEHNLGKKSIAVLPFTTIDRTEESEIFGEGIHDDILTQIAKIHDLKVIARTSVIKYKDTDKGIKDIAKELDVMSILEGSVRRVGDKIRIVAQLIDPLTEEHIWAETYDRTYADIFTIQSDVSQKIALSLKATLTQKELRYIEEVPTDNPEAYENYVIAKILETNQIKAIEYYEKAIELDSAFAEAHAMLSMQYLVLGWEAVQYVPRDLKEKAKYFIEKATALDPTNPTVLYAEGFYFYYGSRDFNKALDKYYLALKSRPNDSDILVAISYIKRRQGKFEESIDLGIKAIEIDPQSLYVLGETGKIAYWMRKWNLAEELIDRAITVNPQYYDGYDFKVKLAVNFKGDLKEVQSIIDEAVQYIHPNKLTPQRSYLEFLNRNYTEALNISNEYQKTTKIVEISDYVNTLNKVIYSLQLGNTELAYSYFDSLFILCNNVLKENPSDYEPRQWLARGYAHLGMKEEALAEVEKVLKLLPDDELRIIDWKNNLSMIYIAIGMFEEAINEVEYLLSRPSELSVNQIKLDPLYDPIRDDPQFQAIIDKYSK